MGLFSGLFGGGSSSSSTSTVESNITVDVKNTLDTTGLGEGFEALGQVIKEAADKAATVELLQAEISAQATEKIDKAIKLVALLGGGFLIFHYMGK